MRRRLAYAVLLAIVVACAFDASHSCGAGDRCVATGWATTAATAASLGALVAVAVIVARRVWQCRSALRGLSALPVGSAEHAIPGGRVTIVDADLPFAFCAGLGRPRVFVSRALTERLGAGELRAVILHEASHARRRDPLRRALRAAAAEILFFAPWVSWWAERAAVLDELTADRAALQECAVGDLAGALLRSGSGTAALAASFDGAAAPRIAHLLGDPPGLPPAPPHVWRRTTAGVAPVLVVLACLVASFLLAR